MKQHSQITTQEYARRNTKFKYWRNRTFYSIMIGYAAFYLVRQNFSVAVHSICQELHITKVDMGLVMSIGGLVYGLGKFLFGLVGDKYSARYVMAIGLALSGIMNILLGISSILPLIIIYYSLNQCFQSMGNPPCMKMLANWFGKTELASRYAIWNISVHVGNSLAVSISPIILSYYGWRYIFYIPGIFCILLSIFLFNRLRDTPSSLGFPSVEEIEGNKLTEKQEKIKLSFKELTKSVLLNKYIWCIALANLFIYINRMTFLNWGPTLLQESRGISILDTKFKIIMILFDISGMIGSLIAGYVSDKVFKGRRIPVAIIYTLLTAFTMYLFKIIPITSTLLNSIIIIFIGSLLTAPIVLINTAATEFSSKESVASATGFTGTFGYIGTAIAGVGNGYLVEHYGWNSVLSFATISAIGSTVLFALLWNKKNK
ncbi:MAG: MFS transporter [Alphaproteobacteria bacterium]|nr:MFS transporter [Alphaproteobacteria bacterium]